MAKELVKATAAGVVTRKDIDDWLMGSAHKFTEQQKTLFYEIASAFNLNPAKREIYAVAYGSSFNVIVGYEVYLKRAERTGMLEWWEATVEKRGDEWVGICTIKRTDRSKPTKIEAWFNEYNQGNSIWKNKPRTMIRKVAIAQAFRMVFSDELGGMPYTSDETNVDPVTVELQSVETVRGTVEPHQVADPVKEVVEVAEETAPAPVQAAEPRLEPQPEPINSAPVPPAGGEIQGVFPHQLDKLVELKKHFNIQKEEWDQTLMSMFNATSARFISSDQAESFIHYLEKIRVPF